MEGKYLSVVLKDKLRHIKNFKSLSKIQFKLGSTKPEGVRSTPPKGTWEETFIEKKGKQMQVNY